MEQLETKAIIVELFAHTHKLQGKEDGPWIDKKLKQTYVNYSRWSILISGSYTFIRYDIFDFLQCCDIIGIL